MRHRPAGTVGEEMAEGVLAWTIDETPIALVDLETTGLSAASDRVIEVSVVRLDPGEPPKMLVDTLVNPERRVTASHIHRITDEDVVDAPTFADVADYVIDAISGCVVAAYNAYFDVRFLNAELGRVSGPEVGPYICLMYTGALAGLFSRCSLREACTICGIPFEGGHEAAIDALAATDLWRRYCEVFPDLQIHRFRDLRRRGSYKFLDSLVLPPLARSGSTAARARFKTRTGKGILTQGGDSPGPVRSAPHREYWEAVKTVLSDLRITDNEVSQLTALKAELGIADEQVRSIHARAFANAIANCIDDGWIDDEEWEKLHRLHTCLHELGWAPGERVSVQSLAPRVEPVARTDLSGKRVVLTGVLDAIERPALVRTLEAMGARVTGGVSSKTDLLIVGENPGSKLDKARTLGIEIWDEERLLEEINIEGC